MWKEALLHWAAPSGGNSASCVWDAPAEGHETQSSKMVITVKTDLRDQTKHYELVDLWLWMFIFKVLSQ